MTTVAEYLHGLETGAIPEDAVTELIEGKIVTRQCSRLPIHDCTVSIIDAQLRAFLPEDWHSRVRCGFVLCDSVLQPDVLVVIGDIGRYDSRHPNADDAALVIEIATSQCLEDRRRRSRIYKTSCVPLYWLVNLIDRRIEVYRPGLDSVEGYLPGERIAVSGLFELAMEVSCLLP